MTCSHPLCHSFYLEWYKNMYGDLAGGSSALDVPHLRRALPAANAIRFVALLWKDSIKASDGLECSTEDEANGYIDPECLKCVRLTRHFTETPSVT